MRISVNVRAGARTNKIEQDAFGLKVYTNVQPEKGKANDAVIQLLAEHFNVAPSRIKIIKGFTGSKKVFEIVY